MMEGLGAQAFPGEVSVMNIRRRRLSRSPWLVSFRSSKDTTSALGRGPQAAEMELCMALTPI